MNHGQENEIAEQVDAQENNQQGGFPPFLRNGTLDAQQLDLLQNLLGIPREFRVARWLSDSSPVSDDTDESVEMNDSHVSVDADEESEENEDDAGQENDRDGQGEERHLAREPRDPER